MGSTLLTRRVILLDHKHLYLFKYSGKVRDIYECEENNTIVAVASDRVSAFDKELSVTIPDKGRILTALSAYWSLLAEDADEGDFYTAYLSSNASNPPCLNPLSDFDSPDFNTEHFAGRCTEMMRLKMFPIECIVRGHIFGSLWKEYNQGKREFDGIQLPDGLKEGDKLPEPIFTPTTKAPKGQHDENITFEQMFDILLKEGYNFDVAYKIRRRCLGLYKFAYKYAADRLLVLADTKFELGVDADGAILFGDELLTPDSSRYWDKTTFVPGFKIESFDKQIIRDFLAAEKARGVETPQLTPEIIERTRTRYIDLFERITGYKW